jgi:hypothetical protein
VNVISLFNVSIVVGIIGVEDLRRIVQLAFPLFLFVPITLSLLFLKQLSCVHRFMEVME